jgi:hypothetical protein
MWIRDSTFENGRSPRKRPDIQTALRYLPMIGAVVREGRQRVVNLRRQRELRPERQLYQICANRQLFQRHPATSTWAFLCAKLLKELKFQSRIGGLDHVRDVGVAGSNPVTPTTEKSIGYDSSSLGAKRVSLVSKSTASPSSLTSPDSPSPA